MNHVEMTVQELEARIERDTKLATALRETFGMDKAVGVTTPHPSPLPVEGRGSKTLPPGSRKEATQKGGETQRRKGAKAQAAAPKSDGRSAGTFLGLVRGLLPGLPAVFTAMDLAGAMPKGTKISEDGISKVLWSLCHGGEIEVCGKMEWMNHTVKQYRLTERRKTPADTYAEIKKELEAKKPVED